MRCLECNFENSPGASYCLKCGAFIADAEAEPGDTTLAFPVEAETAVPLEQGPVELGSASLIVRSGAGRHGEAFEIAGQQMLIGRSPDAEVFLDDVTVSRSHALLVRRRAGLYVDDLGSLNGTYVNRRRIESHKLTDGDELQIGKYKLTYVNSR
jgi:hypothetical protein